MCLSVMLLHDSKLLGSHALHMHMDTDVSVCDVAGWFRMCLQGAYESHTLWKFIITPDMAMRSNYMTE